MSDLTPFLEELRTKILLSDIILGTVKLTRRGREFIGLCPFHQEKGPSFTVNDEKAFYHCFGCGAHGDHISFLMKKQGLPFIEAVEMLADKAGLQVPKFSRQPESSGPKVEENKGVYAVLEAATQWFCHQLLLPASAPVREYLKKRGINGQSVQKFRMGYAPQRGLKEFLAAEGFTLPQMIQAGLLIQPEESGRSPYDRFRGRIIFPIQDVKGRTIAFGGRIIGEGEPKYLNSSESTVFHKGRVLYGLHHALPTAGPHHPFIVVEGYMDVIALHQAGHTTAVAPLGTALTAQQMQLMWRRCGVPTLCFDGDNAGKRAAERAARRALPEIRSDLSLGFCFLPQGEDPDSMLRQGNRETLTAILNRPLPMVDMLWQMLMQNRPLQTPEEKAQARKEVLAITQEVMDLEVRHFYQDDLNTRLQYIFSMKKNNYSKAKNQGNFQGNKGFQAPVGQIMNNKIYMGHKILLVTLINHPILIEEFAEAFMAIEDVSEIFDQIRQKMLAIVTDNPHLQRVELIDCLMMNGFAADLTAILDHAIYQHARFAHPAASIAEARTGWQDVWHRVVTEHQLGNEASQAAVEAKSTLDAQSWEKLKLLKANLLKMP